MPRTLTDIISMAGQDYDIGLQAHYKPLANFINEHNYKRGVEIGTAYGGNAAHLMVHCPTLEELITVDPYKYYDAMPGLESWSDYEQLFLFAHGRLSSFSRCTPVRCTSDEFFEALAEGAITNISLFDFIFLDGDHAKETVLYECGKASKFIKRGGALMGHDYNIFESVNNAVDEYARNVGKTVYELNGNIWYINM